MDTKSPTRAQLAPAEEAGFIGLLDTNQTAGRLGVSRRTVQELVAGPAPKLASIKFGRNVRFHPDDIAQFIASHRVQAAGWKGATK